MCGSTRRELLGIEPSKEKQARVLLTAGRRCLVLLSGLCHARLHWLGYRCQLRVHYVGYAGAAVNLAPIGNTAAQVSKTYLQQNTVCLLDTSGRANKPSCCIFLLPLVPAEGDRGCAAA
jgi:hypothetical protein